MHNKTALSIPVLLAIILASGCSPANEINSNEAGVMLDPVVEIPEPEAQSVNPIGRSDFASMALRQGALVQDNYAISPDLNLNASSISLPSGGSFAFRSEDRDVKVGDKFKASIWLWRDSGVLAENEVSKVALQIVRWCSDTESEVTTETVELTNEPTQYFADHTFMHEHGCALFKVVGINSGTSIMAWDAALERVTSSEE